MLSIYMPSTGILIYSVGTCNSGQAAPAAAVGGLRYDVLAGWVPGHALHKVAVVLQAQAAPAGVHVPQHADVLDGARQQRARVRRPRQVEHVVAVPAPAASNSSTMTILALNPDRLQVRTGGACPRRHPTTRRQSARPQRQRTRVRRARQVSHQCLARPYCSHRSRQAPPSGLQGSTQSAL